METNRQAWPDLESACRSCTACALSKTRHNVVFGKGSQTAKILFVGEAPGETEDLEGKPFVGLSGRLLDHYLDYAGLTENDYYITNILKCRPPKNRDPLPEEENACMGYLKKQLELLTPKIIVCVGRIAAQRIIAPDFSITKRHGEWIEIGAYRIIAVFHPSALLRDPSKKEAMLLDFKKIYKEFQKLS